MSQIKPSVQETESRSRVASAITDTVDAVNGLQDRLVDRYFVPYSVTATYWAFAFVFLYIGLQKVVPHRSAADVPLATIGGIVGIPYITFVTVVGVWQLVIGGLFLLRRLRLCALFFFSYQVFTFATLVVLNKIVFQPPWISLLGVEIPWALGSYAAFVLKNLVFAAIFFVLATQEVGTNGRSDSDDGSEDGPSSGSWPESGWLLGGLPTGLRTDSRGSTVPSAWSRHGRSLVSRVAGGLERGRSVHRRVVDRLHAGQDSLVENYFRPHGIGILYSSYAFVWFYFGLQKPAPVYSPVRHPLSEFFPHLGIPLEAGMVFIGAFEMFLGLLFLFREIRVAFWLFLGHQVVTLLTLVVIPFVAFQPPYIAAFGIRFPWALTGFGAFVIKNVVFVAGFALLASIELGSMTVDTDRDDPEVTSVQG